jgi:uncharacterized protein YvpB
MILTTIDGVPLYSTVEEALQWATSRNLTGYHTHEYQGQTGYMGGANHADINAVINSGTNINTPAVTPLRSINRTTSSGY